MKAVFEARYPGLCFACDTRFPPGARVRRHKGSYQHEDCTAAANEAPAPPVAAPTASVDRPPRVLRADAPRWLAGEDLPEQVREWTDVLIDLHKFRWAYATKWANRPMRDVPDGEWVQAPVFVSNAPGWSLDAMLVEWPSGKAVGASTYVRFTAPDGFRFTFVLAKGSPRGFAAGACSEFFASMSGVFLVRRGTRKPLEVVGPGRPAPGYDLEALTHVVRNPESWFSVFGKGAENVSVEEIQCLLGWAQEGHLTPDSDAVRAAMQNALTPSQQQKWKALTPDYKAWLEFFAPSWHTQAAKYVQAGYLPEQAAIWCPMIEKERTEPTWLADVVAHPHADPSEALALRHALQRAHPERLYPQEAWQLVAPWFDIGPQERRLAYIAARISAHEALAFENSPEPPSQETLQGLAAMLLL